MSASPPEFDRAALSQKRRFGQNFLKDRGKLQSLCESLRAQAGDLVLEIGPGSGALSEPLLDSGFRVRAVEIDFHWAGYLAERFASRAHFELIREDALKADYQGISGGEPCLVIGNLPYNIGAKIILRLLRSGIAWRRMVFLLDQSVSRKLCAGVGTREFGRLAASVFPYASAALGIVIPPEAFEPKPSVMSQSVILSPKPPFEGCLLCYQTLVDLSFLHRRKTLKGNLSSLPLRADAALSSLLSKRAEALSEPEWQVLRAALPCPHGRGA